jgi:hypothetical protein
MSIFWRLLLLGYTIPLLEFGYENDMILHITRFFRFGGLIDKGRREWVGRYLEVDGDC